MKNSRFHGLVMLLSACFVFGKAFAAGVVFASFLMFLLSIWKESKE